ncbi:hypothetical protein [Falsiroseomonas sp.]|uniref:hypothetical protein n=1 Tax=Falsiroseomonas sp. TaxID=2870721 RepID=UPI003F6F6657
MRPRPASDAELAELIEIWRILSPHERRKLLVQTRAVAGAESGAEPALHPAIELTRPSRL